MTEFELKIKATRDYVDYVENHYKNVQKAFAEFTRRIEKALEKGKYHNFVCETKLYEDWFYNTLKAIIEAHDITKLGKEEFTAYRDNFYPLSEKSKQANKEEFDKAWEHHKQKNNHHWQSRVGKTFYECDYLAIENAMDWIAMAYAFNETPINKYYLENKHKMQLSERDTMIIETVYRIMLDKDLEVEE